MKILWVIPVVLLAGCGVFHYTIPNFETDEIEEGCLKRDVPQRNAWRT